MSGEGRPVMRIPSIFDSDDDSEEETRSPMTFRALTTTSNNTTTATGGSATTTRPVTESKNEPPPPAPKETKEPQSLSSNSESDGESFSPKLEAKPVKPLDSPHVQSSSDESDDSEDEGGKDLAFPNKEKLEDEEVEGDDATLVANEEDDINISHSSPENQDGSDDDDDDSSNSDDDDDEDDESDDEQDRSGSSIEYEGTMLSQKGGSHVVYSPATPLSIKITTAKKGEFAIRQEPPSSKSPFHVESEGDSEEIAPKQQDKKPSAGKEREILKESEDKKACDEKMELAEAKKAEKTDDVIQKDKARHMEETKDEEHVESNKSLVDHEKTGESENKEKVCDLNMEAEDKTISSEIKEESVISDQKDNRGKEPPHIPEVIDVESSREEAIDKEIRKDKTLDNSENEPVDMTVREERTSTRSEVVDSRDESDGSDSGALEIESPESQEIEMDKDGKEEEDKEDEPMEVEEETDMESKGKLNKSNDSDVVVSVKEVKNEDKVAEEKDIREKATVDIITTFRKEEKEEEKEIGKAPVDNITTFRKEETKEGGEIGLAPSDTRTTFQKERKEDEEEMEGSFDAKTTFRRKELEEEEEIRVPVHAITTFRKEEKKEEEIKKDPGDAKPTFGKKEKEEKEIQDPVNAVTTFRKEGKKEEEEEEDNSIEMQERINKTDTPMRSEKQDEKGYENLDTERKLEIAVDDEDVEMKECTGEDEEEKKGADRKSSKARESLQQPPPQGSLPVAVMLDSDTDSEATMDAERAQGIIKGASTKGTKVPLRVEDVYLDSEDDSRSLSKPLGEGGSDNAAGNGDGGGQSTMTSETDSVDPEDQRDCLSQHSSSRASSTDLFSKVSSSSPRAESPSDTPTRPRHSAWSRKSHAPTPADLARYTEAFKKGCFVRFNTGQNNLTIH